MREFFIEMKLTIQIYLKKKKNTDMLILNLELVQ